MKKFIQTYDNVISESFSKQLISMFEENPEQHEEIVLEGHRSFTQVTLQNHPEWQPFCVNLQEKFYEYIDKCMKDWRKLKTFTIKSSGYDAYFGLSSSALADDTEFEVKDGATKGQIKTAFVKSLKTKKLNKKVLGEFVSLVA